MDNTYLLELINEAQGRGGGLLLNLDNHPAAVVLTIDKYNQLMTNIKSKMANDQVTLTVPQPREKQAGSGRAILVTGGAGYIGSHLIRHLIKAGFKVTTIDNLSAGRKENLDPKARLIEGDLADANLLRDIFSQNNFEAVFHMAASIEVEESVREPQKYFENNVLNTAKLLRAMSESACRKIIFSSTAAVYGEQEHMPIEESAPLRPNNPYGQSKLLAEEVIKYFCQYAGFSAVIFRYFNACGFDFEGGIAPTHTSHLIPIVIDVAKGRRPVLKVYGGDYNTFDGTCIRDYVHVLDIVHPHILALDKISSKAGFKIFNIGTGHGSSVKEVVNAASESLNKIIPMEVAPRRPGDAPMTVADNGKLQNELGYRLQYSDLPTIIKTSWQ